MAAPCRGTCVVEAPLALGGTEHRPPRRNVARHVAAVRGRRAQRQPAGCHRLLKEGGAVLVSDAAELAELLAG